MSDLALYTFLTSCRSLVKAQCVQMRAESERGSHASKAPPGNLLVPGREIGGELALCRETPTPQRPQLADPKGRCGAAGNPSPAPAAPQEPRRGSGSDSVRRPILAQDEQLGRHHRRRDRPECAVASSKST